MSSESKYAIASRLAQFLRRNGDKVINGSCKLSLTTSALCLLNTLFAEVLLTEEEFGLSNTSGSCASDISADVKFLYDFMKRTSSLKLFHGVQTLRGGVDLSHFSNLTALELRKIPAHLIIGLDSLSVQLKALNVNRSIYLLKEIFGTFLDVQKTSYTWSELKELNLSYNYLETLDHSLQCLPNVEVIDLSHNHIHDAEEIQVLKNLCFVNLSYNELIHMPIFNTSSCRTLTKLYLRNNNLEDLDGLDCLFNLEELDVGYNLLSEYHVLSPLDKLKNLKVLNLEGNPLYFHSRHIVLVTTYINQNVFLDGLLLNGKLVSAPQFAQVILNGTRERSSSSQHQTSINTVVGDANSIVSAPTSIGHISNIVQNRSNSYEDNSISSLTSDAEQLAISVRKKEKKSQRTSKVRKKGRKIRDMQNDETDDQVKEKRAEQINPTENSTVVKAKELIEARRRERGDMWLIPDHSFQRLMIPAPQVPSNTPVSSFLGTQTGSKIEFSSKETHNTHSPDIPQPLSSTPNQKEMTEILDIATVNEDENANEQVSKENDDIEILSSNCEVGCCIAEVHGTMSKDDLSDCDIYRNEPSSHDEGYNEDQNEWLDSEEESEDSIFFVERQDQFISLPISVNIGPNYIKEKDVSSAKVLDRLDLNSLLSVAHGIKEEDGAKWCEVQLEFDTVKPSRQKRLYKFFDDSESATVMSKMLQPFADAKTLKDVTLGALECMKCNSQFSKQVAHKILLKTKKPLYAKETSSSDYDSSKEYFQEISACPNCKNHILVEMESFPMPAISMSPGATSQTNYSKKSSDRSPDNVSIGSSSSGGLLANLYSSMKKSPILKKKSVAAIQGDKNQDAENSNNATENSGSQMRRISSDVTIISETSQSSIAVIPDPELNLHTILERDSLNSISPPISQDSIYYKANYTSESEGYSANIVPVIQNAQPPKVDLSEVTEDDHDFYSFTESSTTASAKNCKTNEVLSSGSENYPSPYSNKTVDISETDVTMNSKELDEVSHLLNILGEKSTITYDAFSEINHRLKLHLEINIFKDNEQLEACLHTSIVPLSTGDEFSGLFAISSKKIYVIKFLPTYSKNLQLNKPIDKTIQIIHSSPLNQLSKIKSILGSQGFTVVCGSNSSVFTLVIRDADICNTFSSLLSDFIQEHQNICGKVEFLSSADEILQLMKESVFSSAAESEAMPEILLHLFAFWCNNRTGENDTSHPVCVIVTPEDIFISRILYKKQDSVPDLTKFCAYHYTLMNHQKLSDLVSLKLKKDLRSVEISFHDESSFQENCDSTFWTIRMATKSALFSFVSALKNPWEEIFHVPLTLECEREEGDI